MEWSSSSQSVVEEPIVVSPLFQALSKPAQLWGVDYQFVLMSGMGVILVFIASNSLFSLLLFLPLHVLGWILGQVDRHIFKLISVRAQIGRTPNSGHWGGQSYDAF